MRLWRKQQIQRRLGQVDALSVSEGRLRALFAAGRLEIESGPGAGTTIVAEVPLQ
jgi:hypothetical protein